MEASESQQNGIGPADDVLGLFAKYQQEKLKRIRPEGNSQFLELQQSTSRRLSPLADDPWVDHEALNKLDPALKDGDNVKVLILGAGFGGLLYAIRLIEAGFRAQDLRIIDGAGGFGGAWYYNRYPGLMCDVESSVYLPLLEETGYCPKHRFSYGPELRAYANLIAEKWELTDKASFRTVARSYDWHEATHRWHVAMTQGRGPDEASVDMTVEAQFVVPANGILNHPKTPKIPGIEEFAGDMMHTSRWNYKVSGGSSADPTLSGLRGKKVAIIGTGSTAVQVMPHLATWADKLFVFQRTPSAVDQRGQRATDAAAWKQMTSKKGWWKERNTSWAKAISGYPDAESQIDDDWSRIRGYKHVVGGPHSALAVEEIPQLVEQALAEDVPRMERLRRRVDEVVAGGDREKETADALKAWYHSWCKRPTFHDDYLEAFNRPNVTLVDTAGKGVDSITAHGLVVAGKEYEADVLILATGFRSPSIDAAEPSARSNVSVRGRETTLRDKWLSNGASTLHGVLTNSFPNLILSGPSQAGISANYCYVLDNLARHAAHLITETLKRAASPDTATVEPTKEAEEAWSMEILASAGWLSPFGACGPSYMNNEGEMAKLSPGQMTKMARSSPYGEGAVAFEEAVEKWRAEGNLQGLSIS